MGWPAVPQHRRSRSFPGRLLHHEKNEETVYSNKSLITSELLWICSGFKSELDPAFYLNVDLDPDPTMRNKADPDSSTSQTLKSQKVLHEKYT